MRSKHRGSRNAESQLSVRDSFVYYVMLCSIFLERSTATAAAISGKRLPAKYTFSTKFSFDDFPRRGAQSDKNSELFALTPIASIANNCNYDRSLRRSTPSCVSLRIETIVRIAKRNLRNREIGSKYTTRRTPCVISVL